MPKIQPKKNSCIDHLALSNDEVQQIADGIAMSLAEEPDTLAAFLLLCHHLTYTRLDRENFLCAIEKACAPFMHSFADALHTDMESALAMVRKQTEEGAS